MDLNDVLTFAQVVQSGSFTAAARKLGIQKSGASRRVAALEESLGTRLLQRTTRALRLTDEGRVFYDHCLRALAELEDGKLALGGMVANPRGVLRVTAPLSFGFVGPIVAEFLQRWPEMEVELVCTDRVVDLVEEGFDVAIRAGTLPDSSLIARRIGSLPRFLVASPSYLRRRRPPRQPADLATHDCVSFGTRRSPWLLQSEGESIEVSVSSRLLVNDFDLLRQAVVAGLGIGLLPEPDCVLPLTEGRLKQLLPAWTSVDTPIHAVYPSLRHLSSKTKVFVDHLQARMGQPLERSINRTQDPASG
ncbi:LysR family transcriptional regulator [Vulgatibacter incomptus]|uniref:Transcriptional regulator, LysR family n=1 Tax=Vulgatibacter incomptus TaxID=1391653 RepID=A0A0K1PH38_9BACT|nr:LysR family transcriptional regulator [Vulgatibacter incomptus]AKU92711.1 Transcriptional regulator, LysR family [Vulgatibacter incomptus]